jgi:hypothetical protein
MRVFLLEDEDFWKTTIEEDLQDLGHKVESWTCVAGAAEKIKKGGFDLLVVDIVLPPDAVSTGIEIRDGGVTILEDLAREGLRYPTLFYSVEGYKKNQDRISALELSISKYVNKSDGQEKFLREVQEIDSSLAKRKRAQQTCSIEEPPRSIPKMSSDAGGTERGEDEDETGKPIGDQGLREWTAAAPGTLSAEARFSLQEENPSGSRPAPLEDKQRWINAEIENHAPSEPLQMGQEYTLSIDIDVETHSKAIAAKELNESGLFTFEELVELTVQVASDDFEIHTEPQKLRLPRRGKSKNKARFDIEPKHQGKGLLRVVFLKEGNFVQLITLDLWTIDAEHKESAPVCPKIIPVEVKGRPLSRIESLPPRDLSLQIIPSGSGDHFQLIMSGSVASYATLRITTPQLAQMINSVRDDLQKIVQWKANDNHCIYQERIDIPAEVNQAALSHLAKAGFGLYQSIFYGSGSDAQSQLLGDKLRQIARGPSMKIQIISQQFFLPWGILYLADRYDPKHIDPECFLGFKHIIEHIPLQPRMDVLDGEIDSRPAMVVSLNVNEDIDLQMGHPLIARQRTYWEDVSRKCGAQVTVRTTKDEVMNALSDARTTGDLVFYFCCHAISKVLPEHPGESCLILTNRGCLTLNDLHRYAPARAQEALAGNPLVFINACESAELSPLFYDGFVPYFMEKGSRGVIGTECSIPALFAAEWAKRFFNRFLSGESVGQAFLELRREFLREHHNVLGLLYALYCDGDTTVSPALQIP